MEQTLGSQISARRKQLGMTQEQLAEKLSVTAQAVSKWENDQSCPDITTLVKLADIFGISVDALLGRASTQDIHEAEVVENDSDDDFDDDFDDSENDRSWSFRYDNSKRAGIGFGLYILLVGGLWLASTMLELNVGLWDIAWPLVFFVFGIFGLWPRFSFIRLGCVLLGVYYLLNHFSLLPFGLSGKNLLLPAFLIIFGLSVLLDALKKPHKNKFSFTYHGHNKDHRQNQVQIHSDRFDYSASFGQATQRITMEQLRYGSISTSFGEYTVDLTGVNRLTPDCLLEISNSFGELTLLVPKYYLIKCNGSTAFADIHHVGSGDGSQGIIHVDASCSFGEITIQYT
jgi:transcriptional regulator with XRE-family HTH domain